MGLPADQLDAAMIALCAIEPAFARGVERVGMPGPRVSARGYATLLRTIVGQQVSVASAAAVYGKLAAAMGDIHDPARLTAASDEDLAAIWKFSFGEHVISADPRSLTYRKMFFNHIVHHRAQLGVYLRLNDLPVPGLYGPSADEPFKP